MSVISEDLASVSDTCHEINPKLTLKNSSLDTRKTNNKTSLMIAHASSSRRKLLVEADELILDYVR